MKKIKMILSGLLLLTLANITVGSGKLDLYQKHFITDDEFNSLILVMDAKDENILIGVPDYPFEKSDSLEPWVQIPLNLSAKLYSVLFMNESIGFAVGFKTDWHSLILKTIDGGISWNECNINTRVNINSITQADSTTLVTVGGGWNGVAFESVIYKTTDLGINWTRYNLTDVNALNSVSFLSNGYGASVGEYGIIYITTNKGATWAQKHIGSWWTDELSDACFFDSTHIIAVGFGGKILISNDLGISWDSVNSSTTKTLYSIEKVGSNLYIAGESGLVLFSSDFGNTWQSQTKVTNAHLYGIHFSNFNIGYLVGGRNDISADKSVILKTTDSGITWNKLAHPSNAVLYDIFFINELVGWAVGDSGLILKTTNGGVTFIEDEENNFTQPKEFLLEQNYPNPFNPSTSIQYAISSTQLVTLKVYDLLGREVATLVNEEKTAGSYNAQFTMNNVQLSSGIYFYKLQAGDFVETKKMILLK